MDLIAMKAEDDGGNTGEKKSQQHNIHSEQQ